MTDEEQMVVNYLAASPEALHARREIARKAARRQVYDEDPHWADAALASLLAQSVIEQNKDGFYRLNQKGNER